MFGSSLPKDSGIANLLKTYTPEEFIFRQGKPGENMYIIIEGHVRIVFESETIKHLVGIAGPGEVLGEKAVLREKKDYIRNFSAIASTDVTLLEVNPKTLDLVLTTWPDFYIRILRLVEQRLQKANELVAILQNPSAVDRVCNYMLYFQKHLCGKLPKGMYATISLEEITSAANVDRETVEDVLLDLTEKKVVSRVADGYILADEKAIVQRIPELRHKLAA